MARGARTHPRSRAERTCSSQLLRGGKRLDLSVPRAIDQRARGARSADLRTPAAAGACCGSPAFRTGATVLLRREIGALQRQGAHGFVLDLRDNPGGLLTRRSRSSSLFLERGVVVVAHGGARAGARVCARSGGAVTRLPLVVLVDRYTRELGGDRRRRAARQPPRDDRRRADLREGARPGGRPARQRRRARADDRAATRRRRATTSRASASCRRSARSTIRARRRTRRSLDGAARARSRRRTLSRVAYRGAHGPRTPETTLAGASATSAGSRPRASRSPS